MKITKCNCAIKCDADGCDRLEACTKGTGEVIGAVIAWMQTGATGAFWAAFAYNGLTVAAGEAIACYVLGTIILRTVPKIRLFREL